MSFLDDSDRSKLGRQRRRNGLYRVQEQISRPIKGSAAICSCLCSMIEFRFWWLLGSELTELKVVSKEGYLGKITIYRISLAKQWRLVYRVT
ncbi:hypothetical protein PC116_g5964 [Phytophthora cactorum]|uniref:Uncharacterized protein n=1 Tax=Phytophthora cactorum TaxID=29920 RepID=A0A8T1LFC5_9STRA|nr:hypothetical protein PC112_g3281 [Phytophthora cactorum]KAG2866587.1 hypothetical protein PC113_g2675 [Phytophthora cactorum]KAG2927331.1 hypothetical protein PC114_g3507 [Phytophthora cactorum]KAG2940789.1 hypothetical protein PC115_g2340 [Phytophthora cactorum]KAG2952434.1 hypothetical protein PC117_g2794 [Phytophthora cactorum]